MPQDFLTTAVPKASKFMAFHTTLATAVLFLSGCSVEAPPVLTALLPSKAASTGKTLTAAPNYDIPSEYELPSLPQGSDAGFDLPCYAQNIPPFGMPCLTKGQAR